MNTTMSRQEWLLLGLLSVLWGGSFFFGKVALAELKPFTVVLGRVGFAALTLVILARLLGHRLPLNMRLWGAFFIMGALNNLIPFSLIFWGQTQIASSLAAILNATTPLFTVVLAHLVTEEEKINSGKLFGILLGLVGVTIMIGPEALGGFKLHVVGQIAIFGAALSYALAGLYGRRFREYPPLVTATGQVTATTAMMIPIVFMIDQPWNLPAPSPVTWGALVALALLSTAVAYVIYFQILATAGATNLLLVTFLIPVSAILLGVIILGERLDIKHFMGMALIMLGLTAVDGRLLSYWKSHTDGFRTMPRKGTFQKENDRLIARAT